MLDPCAQLTGVESTELAQVEGRVACMRTATSVGGVNSNHPCRLVPPAERALAKVALSKAPPSKAPVSKAPLSEPQSRLIRHRFENSSENPLREREHSSIQLLCECLPPGGWGIRRVRGWRVGWGDALGLGAEWMRGGWGVRRGWEVNMPREELFIVRECGVPLFSKVAVSKVPISKLPAGSTRVWVFS